MRGPIPSHSHSRVWKSLQVTDTKYFINFSSEFFFGFHTHHRLMTIIFMRYYVRILNLMRTKNCAQNILDNFCLIIDNFCSDSPFLMINVSWFSSSFCTFEIISCWFMSVRIIFRRLSWTIFRLNNQNDREIFKLLGNDGMIKYHFEA